MEILQRESAGHRFAVHAYCVMPNHFHGLVSGLDERSHLLEFVKGLKRASQWQFPPQRQNRKAPTEKRAQTSSPALAERATRATVAATKPTANALWQKKVYDHILRGTDNFYAIAGYIWMNPVRAGLCGDPRDYRYSGSFTMDWGKMVWPPEPWLPPCKKAPTGQPA